MKCSLATFINYLGLKEVEIMPRRIVILAVRDVPDGTLDEKYIEGGAGKNN